MTTFLMRAGVIAVGETPASFDLELTLGRAWLTSTTSVSVGSRPVGVICVAYVALSELPTATEGTIEIPVEERRAAEFALDTTARLIALDQRTSHRISSPMPFVGFWSDQSEDLAMLEGLVVDAPAIKTVQGATGRSGVLTEGVLAGLADRLDGVALLAEALNNDAPLGRNHQFIRLFERAFAMGPHELTTPLATLLSSCGQGFTLQEVQAWTDARGPSAHADRRSEFFLDADVQLFMPRMLQAGFDVLLNKTDWRSKSSSRRDVWRLNSGSGDRSGAIFLTKGAELSIAIQVLDGFAAYPLVLAGPFDQVLPPGVWLHGDANGGVLKRNENTAVQPPPRFAGSGEPKMPDPPDATA